MTNAHVVAGADADGIRVSDAGGPVFDAMPVVFDPTLDIALLARRPSSTCRRSRFATPIPSAAAIGAALGYPGGGPLTILPAAVSDRYPATGLDIYGDDRVRREILELRAAIDRGDSGGPLVLANGTVGGVVFAESRTNERRRLRPGPDRRVGRDRARHRPDDARRHRGLRALTVAPYTGLTPACAPLAQEPDPDARPMPTRIRPPVRPRQAPFRAR